jgi:hypothetical protein
MFGELPKLLDRNYVVGFFLPAALLSGFGWWVLGLYGLVPELKLAGETDTIVKGSLAVAFVWLVSILLMALNLAFYRALQGYPPFRIGALDKLAKRRFSEGPEIALQRQAAFEADRAGGVKAAAPPAASLAGELREAVEQYPDQLRHVLPTRFGNRMRAAEVYARVVYGMDTVPLWPRLQGLLTPEFRELFNSAKAQLDFCVNLTAAGAMGSLFFLVVAAVEWRLPSFWPPAVALTAMPLGYALCMQASITHGRYLRAAFDLHREALARQLGLAVPATPEEERKMWTLVSKMLIYRSTPRFDELAPFRAAANPKGPAKP